MTYEETLQYLYTSTPVYQHSGASAYKPGLDTSISLDNYLGNPHHAYKTIHVAGTNGKGSVCHLLASVLQSAGYKVGLYTSPHLIDFRERIRVNGQMISKQYITGFVEKHRRAFEPLHPSFFELTSSMAFDYFRSMGVDIAVIETGLGGRLDSTNIITPILSIITSISKDHTSLLGDTLGEIAYEKAGIIKEGVPVVIGPMNKNEIVEGVFRKKAEAMHAPLHTTEYDMFLHSDMYLDEGNEWEYVTVDYETIFSPLLGEVQLKNTLTVLNALRVLSGEDIRISQQNVANGFDKVVELTGLQGRWQAILDEPYTILDTGHNPDAWKYLSRQISEEAENYAELFMIIGLSNDKDVQAILNRMPKEAEYLFTQANIERALPAEVLAQQAEKAGLTGETYPTVADAIYEVLRIAEDDDMVFIGGSNFVVAEALRLFEEMDDNNNLQIISLS